MHWTWAMSVGKDKEFNEKGETFTPRNAEAAAHYWPSFSLACPISSSGSDGNIAVIHLCFPLLVRHKTSRTHFTALFLLKPNWFIINTVYRLCYSLGVRLEQDLVFELLAFTKLQVEDEAWDILQLLTKILHFQLPDLGMYKHHELPWTAKQKQFIFPKSLVALYVGDIAFSKGAFRSVTGLFLRLGVT